MKHPILLTLLLATSVVVAATKVDRTTIKLEEEEAQTCDADTCLLIPKAILIAKMEELQEHAYRAGIQQGIEDTKNIAHCKTAMESE